MKLMKQHSNNHVVPIRSGLGRMKTLVAAAIFTLGVLPLIHAMQPMVAIHDSELTRALESMPASGATPTGAGTTSNQWWTTQWHYFVMPDSAKEALRSDGTAFAVVSDADISTGSLLDANGLPEYPIVVSFASEAVSDDEIAYLTNYVAAGGYLLVGSSAFTRNTNGTTRGDFAFANQLGVHMATRISRTGRTTTPFPSPSTTRLSPTFPAGCSPGRCRRPQMKFPGLTWGSRRRNAFGRSIPGTPR